MTSRKVGFIEIDEMSLNSNKIVAVIPGAFTPEHDSGTVIWLEGGFKIHTELTKEEVNERIVMD